VIHEYAQVAYRVTWFRHLRGSGDRPVTMPLLATVVSASADPVRLDDDHALSTDIGQVDEHQRTSLDSAQPGRIAGELPAVQEDHRFAYG